MKRWISLFIVMVFVLSLASCGNQSKNQNNTKKPATAAATTKATATPTTAAPTASTAATVTQSPAATSTPDANQHKPEDYQIQDVIQSKALKNNTVGERLERQVYVYLPPSYFDSDKKYPVLYFLHGFQEAPRRYLNMFAPGFDLAAKKGQEFIVVCVDGAAQNVGSFYVNSPVSGNWEDYVVNEVVGYVDQKYRTLDNKDSRGIFGFSMGGFGALNLAMRHPDVFGAVYAMSPGLLADGDLKDAWDSWNGDDTFKLAYGRAFSPNKKEQSSANLPTFDGSAKDKKIIKDWENGFGDFKGKIKAYLKKDTKLRAIAVQYGTNDNYKWIPRGSEVFIKALRENKIDCKLLVFGGGHNIKPYAANTDIAPFFAKNLVVK